MKGRSRGSKYIKGSKKRLTVRLPNGLEHNERRVSLSGKVIATSMVDGKVSIGVSPNDLWELIDQEHRSTEVENKMLMQRLRVATGK